MTTAHAPSAERRTARARRRRPGNPVMVHYDPFSYAIHDDPYPIYRRLRDEAPAYYNSDHDFWTLSRYDDVRDALLDHASYCSSQGFVLEDIEEIGLPLVIGMDPPDHTRVRSTISRALTPRRIASLEPHLRGLTAELLTPLAERGRADIVDDFAALLPMAVISEMLCVPAQDRDMLRRLADEMVHRDDSIKGLPARGAEAGAEIAQYFAAMLEDRAATPGDDLPSMLLAAERDGDLGHDEIIGFCFLLIIAGNETTTRLIGNMVYQLGSHPDERRRLTADPSLVPSAVEETLRYDPSTHMMARTLTSDVELHGRTMTAGKKVALILASANRDERHWHDPERFDVGRDSSGHLALGIGIHHCLGAALARLEARVALEALLARIPDFEVDCGGLVRVHSGNVRGFSRIPITFDPAPSP